MSEQVNGNGRLVITVDVEDWPQSTWDHDLEITERSARNTEHVLEILARFDKTATMFVLGKFAEKFPEIVKRIVAEGHELSTHGHGHIEIFLQTPEVFRADVRRAKCFLEDLTGAPVFGYRAPDFSIVEETTWALEILAELGFIYDSSIFPIKHSRYGIENFPTGPVRVMLPSGASIIELPPSTRKIFGRQMPVAGGGYHRLLPWVLIQKIIEERLFQSEPFVAYCHPYEFDLGEFAELDLGVPIKTRLHQSLGRRGFQRKFENMLENFDIVSAIDLTSRIKAPDYIF